MKNKLFSMYCHSLTHNIKFLKQHFVTLSVFHVNSSDYAKNPYCLNKIRLLKTTVCTTNKNTFFKTM